MLDFVLHYLPLPFLAALAIVIGHVPLLRVRSLGTKIARKRATTRHEKKGVNKWLRLLDRRLQRKKWIGIRAPFLTETVDWLLHALPWALADIVLKVSPSTGDGFEQIRPTLTSLLGIILVLVTGYYIGVVETRFNQLVRRAKKKAQRRARTQEQASLTDH